MPDEVSQDIHVRVCRGRDCRKRDVPHQALLDSLAEYQSAEQIKCQDICKGPVVLVRRGKHKFWFKRLIGEDLLADFRAFIEEGSMTADLVRVLAKKK